MSNPARLYLCSAEAGLAPVAIAESYSPWHYLPGLWRLLLADARPFDYQLSEDDEGIAIGTDAFAAQKRLTVFRRVVDSHPLLHRIPGLPVYLAAVDSFLREQMAAFPWRQIRTLMLVAHMEEDDETLDEALFDDLAVLKATVDGIVRNGRHWELDTALDFADARLEFSAWLPWARRFGLDTLSHPYFSRLEISLYDEGPHAPPPAVRFEDFEREPGLLRGLAAKLGGMFGRPAAAPRARHSRDEVQARDDEPGEHEEDEIEEADDDRFEEEESDDPWFDSGFRPVHVGGKVGLRFVPEEAVRAHWGSGDETGIDPDPDRLALAPEWDELLFIDNFHTWVRRGRLWAPVKLLRHCVVLTEPCVDEVVQEEDSWASHVVRNGLRGLLCEDTGRWLAEPRFDEMIWSHGRHHHAWRVRKGERWGLLSPEGVLLHDCVFDAQPRFPDNWRDEGRGLHVRREGRAGWIGLDGTMEIDCAWDEVHTCAIGLFTVRQGERWGLAASGKRQWLPPVYLSVEPLMLAPHLGVCEWDWCTTSDFSWPDDIPLEDLIEAGDPSGANLLIAVRTEAGMGVVDQDNRIVVPPRYATVAPAENGGYRDARWLIVTDRDGGVGLWSFEAGGETIACEHRGLDLFVAPRLQRPLVGIPDGRHYRLLHTDGTSAYEESFLSLSEDAWLRDCVPEEGVNQWTRERIGEAWNKGVPARAKLADEAGTIMSLLPGRPLRTLEQVLADDYRESGSRKAALTLAEYHRDRDEFAEARRWAARACGHEAHPAGLHKSGVDDDWPLALNRLREDASVLFATLLDEGLGGPRDAALALRWAREAIGPHISGVRPGTCLLLARLLLDPTAGGVDRAAALPVLAEIRHPALEVGMAALLEARCVLDDPQPDLERARALLVTADGGGAEPAALELAALLDRLAGHANKSEAPTLRREAAYYRAKAAARALDAVA